MLLINRLSGNDNPDELDVLVQAEEIEKSLEILGFSTLRIYADLNLDSLQASLNKINPDLVFNLVESLGSKAELSHLVPALLESMDLPFTGADSLSMLLTSDKVRAKYLFSEHGISSPEYFTDYNDFMPEKSKYYILKPVWEDASVGISDISVMDAFDSRIEQLLKTRGRKYFAEEYIHGREFNISLIGNAADPEIFPAAEIIFLNYPAGKAHILNYNSKWIEDSFEYKNSVRSFEFGDSDTALLRELKEISLRCWKAFRLKGYARVDFRVDKHNRIFVLEINANPCLSPDAGFIAASKKAGLEFKDVIGMIVKEALTR